MSSPTGTGHVSKLRAGPGLPQGLRLTIIEDGPLAAKALDAPTPAPVQALQLAAAIEDRLAQRLLSLVYDVHDDDLERRT
jgi:hypothetical protein